MKVRVTSEKIRGLREELSGYFSVTDAKSKELIEKLNSSKEFIDCNHTHAILSRTALLSSELEEALRHLQKQIEKLDDIASDYEETEMNNVNTAQLLG